MLSTDTFCFLSDVHTSPSSDKSSLSGSLASGGGTAVESASLLAALLAGCACTPAGVRKLSSCAEGCRCEARHVAVGSTRSMSMLESIPTASVTTIALVIVSERGATATKT